MVGDPGQTDFRINGQHNSEIRYQVIGGPETQNPFDGIMRAIVAVFLIPGTQVIVSWSIDAGNSMTYSVRDWVDARAIADWAHQLSFNTSLKDNAMLPPRPQPGASSGAKKEQ